ncbi:hypothetical protein F8O07_06570 [Pseudoclavibacter sp. CFCC 13796]|uniref:hypothetical protein n=1 Tax=Pseudoclavibacter sp. CFCC 13796 TaxID=2615179 RepID=UPI0013014C32|nr:hypothetical protein [Pseudoclavibacter sp. CFCC 13796]KAB1661563.1 hypothetical protein F8O07_06570 [Pseudoclavibacter sp. CFCC 13796]
MTSPHDFTRLEIGTPLWMDVPHLRYRERVLVQRLTATQVIVHRGGIVYRFRRGDGTQVGGKRRLRVIQDAEAEAR